MLQCSISQPDINSSNDAKRTHVIKFTFVHFEFLLATHKYTKAFKKMEIKVIICSVNRSYSAHAGIAISITQFMCNLVPTPTNQLHNTQILAIKTASYTMSPEYGCW